jgi:hypothetical protein
MGTPHHHPRPRVWLRGNALSVVCVVCVVCRVSGHRPFRTIVLVNRGWIPAALMNDIVQRRAMLVRPSPVPPRSLVGGVAHSPSIRSLLHRTVCPATRGCLASSDRARRYLYMAMLHK